MFRSDCAGQILTLDFTPNMCQCELRRAPFARAAALLNDGEVFGARLPNLRRGQAQVADGSCMITTSATWK